MSEQATVLIVEDDGEQIAVAAAMLSNEPFTLLTAMSGQRALEILRSVRPCLAMIDLVLPDIPGSDLVQDIRADARLKSTKIIAVTSFERYVTDHVRQLADRVLIKPLAQDSLLAAMHELLAY